MLDGSEPLQPEIATPKIATFAPEIIDLILEELVASIIKHTWDPSLVPILSSASLLSRAWTGPAQRRLMSELVVTQHPHVQRLLCDGFTESELRLYVKKLSFPEFLDYDPVNDMNPCNDSLFDAMDDPTVAPFLNLLPHLPNISMLSISSFKSHYNVCRPRPLPIHLIPTSFYSLQNLRTLRVALDWQDAHEQNLVILHRLLSSAPNLTNFDFATELSTRSVLPPSKYPPISLPQLRSLYVAERTTPTLILSLLTPTTISNITDLTWTYLGVKSRSSNLPLCKLVGPTLKRLTYNAPRGMRLRHLDRELGALSVLEELTLWYDMPEIFEALPSTLKILHLRDYTKAANLLVDPDHTPEDYPPGLHTITIYSEGSQATGSEKDKILVEDFCKKAGINLISE
ncbi:hypothetical protein P7C70_g7619, partial [Phenoliferia sp. Uapishka_3]